MTVIKRNMFTAAAGWTLFFIILTVFQTFVPVAAFMSAKGFTADETSITSRIVGYKWRSCDPVPGSFVGWVKDEEWREVGFNFPNDLTPDSSKPATFERQSFGLWRWEVNPAIDQTVKMTMQHNCNGTIRTSTFGPFEYLGGG